MHHDRCLPGPGNRPTSLRATAHQVTGLEKPLSGWGRDLPPWWSFEPVGIARRCLPTFSPHTSFPRLCLRFSIASRLPWACDPLVGGQRGSLHKPSVRRVHRDPLRVRVFARLVLFHCCDCLTTCVGVSRRAVPSVLVMGTLCGSSSRRFTLSRIACMQGSGFMSSRTGGYSSPVHLSQKVHNLRRAHSASRPQPSPLPRVAGGNVTAAPRWEETADSQHHKLSIGELAAMQVG